MPTEYQYYVNGLTGAMGPTSPAMWDNTYKLTGPAYEMSSQPMYFSPERGYYVTSADLPASIGSASFSFGKKRKSRKSRKCIVCKCKGCKCKIRSCSRKKVRGRKVKKVRRGSRR